MDSGVLSSPDLFEATLHKSLENMIVINTVEHPTFMWKDTVIQYPSSRTSLFWFFERQLVLSATLLTVFQQDLYSCLKQLKHQSPRKRKPKSLYVAKNLVLYQNFIQKTRQLYTKELIHRHLTHKENCFFVRSNIFPSNEQI